MALGSGALWAATSADAMEKVGELQQAWAHIKYELPEQQREKAFEQLAERARGYAEANGDSAELLIWDAIVLSTYAGEKGGLGALSLVKEARSRLEAALEVDPSALDGSAYTSLGSLYYQVPGWPVGFGNDKKAEELLKQALSLNPDGIDSNFFYADFLLDQGRKEEAKAVFEKALDAPPRIGRELADRGRRDEIRDKLAQLNAE
ncbi:tetratricopeptide repeat protein [Marinobacterium sp. D7]|nr:tetratricopeptide repeat protein [Marinobacterium ramblicola]